jgi:hypothetical protein
VEQRDGRTGGLCGADRTRRVDEGGSVRDYTAAEEVTESDDGYNEEDESIAYVSTAVV